MPFDVRKDVLGALFGERRAVVGRITFKEGKLPELCQQPALGALLDGVSVLAAQHENGRLHDLARTLLRAHGIALLFPAQVCKAGPLPRAFPAGRRAIGQADDRAQLHERLAEVRRLGGIHLFQQRRVLRSD